jgi:hypothetical protein
MAVEADVVSVVGHVAEEFDAASAQRFAVPFQLRRRELHDRVQGGRGLRGRGADRATVERLPQRVEDARLEDQQRRIAARIVDGLHVRLRSGERGRGRGRSRSRGSDGGADGGDKRTQAQ